MAHYLDTSALVKLVVAEAETDALWAWLSEHEPTAVSSDLARTELMRAIRRVSPDRAPQARSVLGALTLMSVTTEVFERAGQLDPDLLRSLDAIHLAAALGLGDDLTAVVTYDDRLAEACAVHGVASFSPG